MIQEKWLLIGHRGSGKSSFLQGLSRHFESCIDLDLEIEKRSQKKITEIFSKFGEADFRQIEAATFAAILKEYAHKSSVVISLGAGFAAHVWPREYRCLWLRRETDVWPRFFTDRPQMGTSALDSFLSAYIEREQRYQEWADIAWTLDEGEGVLKVADSEWPLELTIGKGATLTLVPRLHKDPLAAIKLRENLDLRFELRSDLWPLDTLKKTLEGAKAPLLLSVRSKKFPIADVLSSSKNKNILWDWDFSFGDIPSGLSPDIISQHDFSSGIKEGLESLEKLSQRYPEALLKAAPIVETFEDLESLWDWHTLNSQKHMIFPRTKSTLEESKWQWLRLLLKGRQKINFIREATEGPKDQPTLSQYRKHVIGESFAAILGDPVFHSFSPCFHHEYFEKKNMPFLAIPMSNPELTEQSFSFLEKLGACAFAVTSPLKEHAVFLAVSSCDTDSAKSVTNTLVKTSGWKRYNTDVLAIREFYASSKQSWRIWGSGAVAKQCFDLLENAELYSSRSAEKVAEKGVVTAASFNLLWAAGDEAPSPPSLWKPNKIFDLSYTQRSHAILYANTLKVDYENGLEFFKVQALAQQEHWKDL